MAVLCAPDFGALLGQATSDNFGTILPVIPFAALLSVLLLLRWGDLREVLSREEGPTSAFPTRLLGAGILTSLVLLRGVTGESVYSAGVAVVLAFYAASLVLNPLTLRIMLPYAGIYSLGVAAPAVLQWTLGEPLAAFSSALSAGLVRLGGIPVSWQGTQFELVSRTGDMIAATVTPGCSSIISVTTFLGLLGLMHLDMKKDASSTLKAALAGVAALVALNSVRISLLVWVGYVAGSGAFWGVHNWVGYALFLGFYLATLAVYPRMGRRATDAEAGLTGGVQAF